MKHSTLIALAATLMLGVAAPAAFAQTTTTTTDAAAGAGAAVDAAAGAATGGTTAGATGGADATATGTTSTTTNTDGTSTSGSTNVSASASFNFDANADGSISADEITAANTALSGQTGSTVSVDANGDGMLSQEEIDAANVLLSASANASAMGEDMMECGDSGIEATISSMGKLDMAMLAAATNVRVVTIANCESADVTSALAAEGAASVQKDIAANAAAVQAIQARGADVSNVLGATSDGDTLTVYVATASSNG